MEETKINTRTNRPTDGYPSQDAQGQETNRKEQVEAQVDIKRHTEMINKTPPQEQEGQPSVEPEPVIKKPTASPFPQNRDQFCPE